MRKLRQSKHLVLLAPVLALLLAGAVIAGGIGGGDQNQDLDQNNDPPGECTCPLNYDPVVCVQDSGGLIIGAPKTERFSNACFAGCAGYTNCFSFAIK